MPQKTPSNRKKYLESQRKSQRRYRIKHWHYRLFENIKVSASRKGLEVEVEKNFILELWDNQRGLCFWTQIPLLKNGPPKHPQKASVDRIDPSKGYLKDNIVLTCQFANLGKSDVNIPTFFEFLRTLRNTFTAVQVINRESSESQPSTETE